MFLSLSIVMGFIFIARHLCFFTLFMFIIISYMLLSYPFKVMFGFFFGSLCVCSCVSVGVSVPGDHLGCVFAFRLV